MAPTNLAIAAHLGMIEKRLDAIDKKLAQFVPPADIRQHIEESAATADQIDGLTEGALIQAEQLAAIVQALGSKLTDDELRKALENTLFVTRQLTAIMQGTRTDIVQMRATLLRLSEVLEQVLRARVDDERTWRSGDDDERRQIEGDG